MLRGTSWESIAENLAAVRRIRSPLAPLVDSLEPVLRLVHREAQAAPLPEIRLVEPGARNGLGLPILPRAEFPVDVAAGVRLVRELLAATSEGPAETRAATAALRERAKDAEWVTGVLLTYASGELEAAASQDDAAGAQQLIFFAGMALRPGLEAAATTLSTWVSSAWAGATCPVCGTGPRLAELRAPDGRRYLHCAFCDFAWQYATTGCPACESQTAEGINLLYVEADRRSRLDVCETCRTYIKCVDNKEYLGLVPLVEDLLSPHLDLLAAEKGYQPIAG